MCIYIPPPPLSKGLPLSKGRPCSDRTLFSSRRPLDKGGGYKSRVRKEREERLPILRNLFFFLNSMVNDTPDLPRKNTHTHREKERKTKFKACIYVLEYIPFKVRGNALVSIKPVPIEIHLCTKSNGFPLKVRLCESASPIHYISNPFFL